jgi:drug/metabolite transporter (DMT)-like permease
MEQIAAYISLFGVVLIARPISLFASFSEPKPPSSGNGDIDMLPAPTLTPTNSTTTPTFGSAYDTVTPTQRATAVGVAMLGVLGAAGAYTTIRWIGRRAHPLISVNYFATWCTLVSIVMMFVLPGVGFLLPAGLWDWSLLVFLGTCGFVMVCAPSQE